MQGSQWWIRPDHKPIFLVGVVLIGVVGGCHDKYSLHRVVVFKTKQSAILYFHKTNHMNEGLFVGGRRLHGM